MRDGDGLRVTVEESLDEQVGGKMKDKKMNAWARLSFALGGEDEMGALPLDVLVAKWNLALLLDWIKLFILKELSNRCDKPWDLQVTSFRLTPYPFIEAKQRR